MASTTGGKPEIVKINYPNELGRNGDWVLKSAKVIYLLFEQVMFLWLMVHLLSSSAFSDLCNEVPQKLVVEWKSEFCGALENQSLPTTTSGRSACTVCKSSWVGMDRLGALTPKEILAPRPRTCTSG